MLLTAVRLELMTTTPHSHQEVHQEVLRRQGGRAGSAAMQRTRETRTWNIPGEAGAWEGGTREEKREKESPVVVKTDKRMGIVQWSVDTTLVHNLVPAGRVCPLHVPPTGWSRKCRHPGTFVPPACVCKPAATTLGHPSPARRELVYSSRLSSEPLLH